MMQSTIRSHPRSASIAIVSLLLAIGLAVWGLICEPSGFLGNLIAELVGIAAGTFAAIVLIEIFREIQDRRHQERIDQIRRSTKENFALTADLYAYAISIELNEFNGGRNSTPAASSQNPEFVKNVIDDARTYQNPNLPPNTEKQVLYWADQSLFATSQLEKLLPTELIYREEFKGIRDILTLIRLDAERIKGKAPYTWPTQMVTDLADTISYFDRLSKEAKKP